MKNQKYFIEKVPPRTPYVPVFDGIESTYSGNCSIGEFQANHSIKALVADTATEQDNWRVVNVPVGHYFDSIAVLGAVDDEQAVTWAIQHKQRTYDSLEHGECQVINTTTSALKRHLDNLSTKYVTKWGLEAEQGKLTAVKPVYDGMVLDGVSLKKGTAYSTFDSLLHEMARNDDDGLMLQPIDDLTGYLAEIGCTVPEFDAIYGAFQHLEAFMKMLHTAMTHAKGNLDVKSFELSKPFKRNGVAQIAVTFSLDDGQTLTIFFHNPEVTPAQLKADSLVISWRYLLNKRDITGVVQPNQGEGISIPQIAGRMMQLANANSKRFKRTNERKAEQAQKLTDLQTSVDSKQQQLLDMDAKIKALQEQVQAKATGNNEKAKAQSIYSEYMATVVQRLNAVNLAFTQNDLGLDFGNAALNYSNDSGVELLVNGGTKASLSTKNITDISVLESALDEKIDTVIRTYTKRAILEGYISELEENHSDLIKDTNVNYSTTNFDDAIIVNFGTGESTYQLSLSDAGFELNKNGAPFSESINTELNNAETVAQLSDIVTPIMRELVPNEPNSKFSDDDIQYLKDIISGEIDGTTADMDKIIYLAEIDETDELLNEAMVVITNAMDKASA